MIHHAIIVLLVIIALACFHPLLPIAAIIPAIVIYYILDRKQLPKSQKQLLDLNHLKVLKSSYIQSTKWKELRRQILFRDSYECQCCRTTGVPLDVHHITYERLTNELPSDLISLCRPCHERQHVYYGYDYNTKFYPLVS